MWLEPSILETKVQSTGAREQTQDRVGVLQRLAPPSSPTGTGSISRKNRGTKAYYQLWDEVVMEMMNIRQDARQAHRHVGAQRLVEAPGNITLPRDAPLPGEIARMLLTWFSAYGRCFSWRSGATPYQVLIAEILLRKTGAVVVEDFLPGFFAVYPNAHHLAAAEPEHLTTLLAPLGLSLQRGYQLQQLALRLKHDFHGEVPDQVSALLTLPGVGPYTAGIVAATCFEADIPAVDTNVARVLCRVFGVVPSHAEPRKSTNVWNAAALLIGAAPKSARRLIWAVLDIGGTICVSRTPRCAICPLHSCCLYARINAAKSDSPITSPREA